MSLLYDAARVESLTVLSRFRTEFYACPTARKDVLFELADTMLCSDGPVKTLVGFALAPEPSRGHGVALYVGLNHGGNDVSRLRRALVSMPLPRAADGCLVLAVGYRRGFARTRTPPPTGAFATSTVTARTSIW